MARHTAKSHKIRKVEILVIQILICVGIIIYIAMSGIDRFVYHIPNIIYIPVAILGIALILIGFFKDKFKQENFDL